MAFRAPGETLGVFDQKTVPQHAAQLSGQSAPRGSADLLAFPEGGAFGSYKFVRHHLFG